MYKNAGFPIGIRAINGRNTPRFCQKHLGYGDALAVGPHAGGSSASPRSGTSVSKHGAPAAALIDEHEHEHNTQQQCNQGGVKGDARARTRRRYRPRGLPGLAQGIADAPHRIDEADRWDGPGDVADRRKARTPAARFRQRGKACISSAPCRMYRVVRKRCKPASKALGSSALR